MPVNNNEHQRIDDVSTDRILYTYTVSRDYGFRFVTQLIDCCIQASQYDRLSQG